MDQETIRLTEKVIRLLRGVCNALEEWLNEKKLKK